MSSVTSVDVLVLRLRSKSAPFDSGSRIELKFEVVECAERSGEMYLRVRTTDGADYAIGDRYTARMVKMP